MTTKDNPSQAGKVEIEQVKPFDFEGLEIREVTPPNLSSASLAQIRVDPGVEHPLARSRLSDKIYVCLSGQVEFTVEGHSESLSPGSVLNIPRNQWFAYRNQTSSEATLLLFHVPPFDLQAEEFASGPRQEGASS